VDRGVITSTTGSVDIDICNIKLFQEIGTFKTTLVACVPAQDTTGLTFTNFVLYSFLRMFLGNLLDDFWKQDNYQGDPTKTTSVWDIPLTKVTETIIKRSCQQLNVFKLPYGSKLELSCPNGKKYSKLRRRNVFK
jgi:hypothetical protein